jgi:hypothetical protein
MAQEWFIENYKKLEEYSKWWNEDWSGLLSSYYEWLDKNWEQFDKIPDGDQRMKWSMNWFKMNGKVWSNSEFMRQNKMLSGREEVVIEDSIIDEGHYFEWGELNDWIKDISTNWNDLEVKELVRCRKLYLTLPLHKRVLWDLYFNQMLSMRDISNKLNLPLTSVYKMLKELKKEIQDGKINMDN